MQSQAGHDPGGAKPRWRRRERRVSRRRRILRLTARVSLITNPAWVPSCTEPSAPVLGYPAPAPIHARRAHRRAGPSGAAARRGAPRADRDGPRSCRPSGSTMSAARRCSTRSPGLPEYYLTRREREILRAHAADIAAITGARRRWSSSGSGTSEKTRLLLDALRARRERCERFVPFDVCRPALERAARRAAPTSIPASRSTRWSATSISTCGALPRGERPAAGGVPRQHDRQLRPERSAPRFLRELRRRAGPGRLLPARHRPGEGRARGSTPRTTTRAGVTAAFNRNVLRVLNRDLRRRLRRGARSSTWPRSTPTRSWIDIRLRSRVAQTVHVARAGADVALRRRRGDAHRDQHQVPARRPGAGAARRRVRAGRLVDGPRGRLRAVVVAAWAEQAGRSAPVAPRPAPRTCPPSAPRRTPPPSHPSAPPPAPALRTSPSPTRRRPRASAVASRARRPRAAPRPAPRSSPNPRAPRRPETPPDPPSLPVGAPFNTRAPRASTSADERPQILSRERALAADQRDGRRRLDAQLVEPARRVADPLRPLARVGAQLQTSVGFLRRARPGDRQRGRVGVDAPDLAQRNHDPKITAKDQLAGLQQRLAARDSGPRSAPDRLLLYPLATLPRCYFATCYFATCYFAATPTEPGGPRSPSRPPTCPRPAIAFAAFWRRLSTYIASSAVAMSASAAVPSSGQLAVPRLSADRDVAPGVRRLKLIAQTADDAAAILRREIRQQHGELVTAGAARNVVRAQVIGQEDADPLEQAVAHLVSVGVVDLFEVVDVDDQHRELAARARALRAADLFLEALLEVAAVPEPGQRVAVRHRAVRLQTRDLLSQDSVLARHPHELALEVIFWSLLRSGLFRCRKFHGGQVRSPEVRKASNMPGKTSGLQASIFRSWRDKKMSRATRMGHFHRRFAAPGFPCALAPRAKLLARAVLVGCRPVPLDLTSPDPSFDFESWCSHTAKPEGGPHAHSLGFDHRPHRWRDSQALDAGEGSRRRRDYHAARRGGFAGGGLPRSSVRLVSLGARADQGSSLRSSARCFCCSSTAWRSAATDRLAA